MSPDWPLETERLTLRPYEEGDFDSLYALQSSDEVARWLYDEPRTPDEAREHLRLKIAGSQLRAEGDWLSTAVVVRESDLMIGDVGLHWVSERDRTAEVGFTFLPAHQGHGFATEAARAVVGWAFGAGFRRVIGRAEPRNLASTRVLEKLGMRLEAHLVENEWVKGEWQSEVDYAILEREWRR